MKIRFFCNSAANAHSTHYSGWMDTKDIGWQDGEWESLPDEQKYREAEQWAWGNGLEIGYEEE